MEKNKNILSQMFDVKPVNKMGNLDLEKIKKVEKILHFENKKNNLFKKTSSNIKMMTDVKAGNFWKKDLLQEIYKESEPRKITEPKNIFSNNYFEEDVAEKKSQYPYRDYFSEDSYFGEKKQKQKNNFIKNIWFKLSDNNFYNYWKIGYHYSVLFGCLVAVVFSVIFVAKSIETKNSVLAKGQSAYASLLDAKQAIAKNNFQKSKLDFNEAYAKFEEISKDMNTFSGVLIETGRFIPYLSKITSGKYLSEAGKNISRIGILASGILENVSQVKNPLNNSQSVSFLDIFQKSNDNLREITALIDNLENNLNKINLDDIPEDKRIEFARLRNQLPEIKGFASGFIGDSEIITDVLGGNGPRKYLFLFQNNNEMRPTGGFIGSYGILDIFDGKIKNFFIDGIFNPDGQLREKVVPPAPIQKISANWSLHDSNWFPDFPASAEKAQWFYEKTGGPKVDGVITITPAVLQKLLKITGPIEMPEYGVTIDENNFIEKVQEEVEVNYDKELNQPKKILSDLAPKLLDKIFDVQNFSDITAIMGILSESLNEKQILIYANNLNIEKKISEKGWSGEILSSQKDYLSVINTNINGYKTDGVMDEKIEHSAQIKDDGTIVDEVSITRHHNGGHSNYEWFNKVNADYMRVYVPKGSRLISAEGQTREFNSSPLDYNSLGFKRDPQVEMEEQSIQIDENSGTRIYDDSGKTVFANWVYVSPQETATIKYTYVLPFKITIDAKDKLADTYSLLAQKQSGSPGSDFSFRLNYPDKYKILWKYPDDISTDSGKIEISEKLNLDRFFGVALAQEDIK
jgi:hypothetical protein